MSGQIERVEDFLGEAPPAAAARSGAAAGTGVSADVVRRRAAAITLAVLSGLALGVFGLMVTGSGAGDIRWLALCIIVIAGLMLLYKNFELGIVLYICVGWMAISTPTVATGGSGGGQQLPLSQLALFALLCVWLTRRIMRQEFTLYHTPVNVPIALYLAICVWSTINGLLLRDHHVVANSYTQYVHVNIIDLGIRFLALGGMVMIGNALRGPQLYWASLAILLPGVATFTGLLPFVPAGKWLAFPQIIALAVLAAFVLTKQGAFWARIGAAVLAGGILFAYAVRYTEWISGWLGALAALAVMLFVAQRRLFWIGCALFVIAVLANWGYVYDKVYVANVESGSGQRFDMLRASFLYASHFPLGIGLGNYRAYNAYYGRWDVWGTSRFSSAHGTYAQALSETGWLGLLVLLFLLAAGTRMLYRYYKMFPEGYAKAYALGALGAFVGVYAASFAGDYLFPAYHNGGMGTFGACVYVFLVTGVVIAMARERGLVWGESGQGVAEREKITPAPVYNRALTRRVEG